MSETTDFLQLVKPGGGSTGLITPPDRVDIDVLNDNSQKIDDWAEKIGNNFNRSFAYYGPAANIGSVTPAPKDGDTYQESDGNKILWKRVGGAWVTNEGGMYLLRPTTLVGCTVSADGAVVPTAAATAASFEVTSLAAFRAVKLVYFLEPAVAALPNLRFRRAGADLVAAASYANERLKATTTTVSSDYVTGTFIDLGASAQLTSSGEITIINAGRAGVMKTWVASCQQGPVNPHIVQLGGMKSDAEVLAALTGFSFGFGGAAFSGTNNSIKLYGLT